MTWNYYMLLYLNDYESLITNKDFDNSFSKILMKLIKKILCLIHLYNDPLNFIKKSS